MSLQNRIFDFIMIFFLVFSFFLVSAMQTSFVAGGIAFLIICTYPNKLRNFARIMFSDTGKILLLGYSALLPINLIFCILNATFDTSYFNTFVMQFIKIVCVLLVVSCLDVTNKEITYYEKLFVAIAFVQSLIQFAAFSNKSIANVVLHFNHASLLYEEYGGRRGLALSGGTGWPLAIVYGLSFLFYTKNFIVQKSKISIFDVGIGVILLLGVLFSGRSAYLGIITSVLFFLICRKSFLKKIGIVIKFIFLLIFAAGIVILLMYLLAKNMADNFINGVLPWAFEFFYKKQSSGSMSTASTDVLLQMWGRSSFITEHTILFGDGWFTDATTGLYFHNVDVGYLRNIFYWGIFGTMFLYLFFISLFIPKLLSSSKNDRIFVFILILTMFILELKAMTVFTAHLSTVMVLFWLFMNEKLEMQKKEEVCNA